MNTISRVHDLLGHFVFRHRTSKAISRQERQDRQENPTRLLARGSSETLDAGCSPTTHPIFERSHRMTPLRQRMIEDMQLRNLTPTTQRNYLHYVTGFAQYFGLSPAVLDQEAVRQYQLHLVNERKLSPETINQYISSVKFLYRTTLRKDWADEYFPRLRRPHKLPIVLSQEEVMAFFDHIPSLKYRAALMTCYGAGLRVSEAVALRVADIDSQRMLIRVEQGKGQKDRYAMLSPRLLEVLRRYWRALRPQPYLFPSWRK